MACATAVVEGGYDGEPGGGVDVLLLLLLDEKGPKFIRELDAFWCNDERTGILGGGSNGGRIWDRSLDKQASAS